MQRFQGLCRAAALLLATGLSPGWGLAQAPDSVSPPALEKIASSKPRNILFILSDDHRYDAMGFMGHPFLETPGLDRLARNGAHFRNAFVTTALCSPSRATILTGLYVHRHGVVDNNNPVRKGLVFFPQYLQQAGYQTAFVGKWHMGGESDAPQRGFDHWVSFRGQGTYLPGQHGLNVNGSRVPQKGYITDALTDYALEWLKQRDATQPFFLFLSHKAVHAEFLPADRHKGKYARVPWKPPEFTPGPNTPRWVQDQRNSWHGVDFPYHSRLDVAEYYKRYCETLLAVDESILRLLQHLEQQRLLDSTLVAYMGDNGFLFGEHGLIDKRVAYEESIRVPLLMHCPELIRPGTVVTQVVANLDIAPTFLELAGLRPPAGLDGQSMAPLLLGKPVTWRQNLLYQYFWERNFPHTPTQFALRGDRYKYIYHHGIWDLDELYDLQEDPRESRNLIQSPEHRALARQMSRSLFELLAQTDGMAIPLQPPLGGQMHLRSSEGPPPAPFPPALVK